MTVKYRAYDRTGQRVDGTLDVDSTEAAQEILERNDLIVVKVKKSWRLPSIHEQIPSLFGIKPDHVVTMSQELSTLLRAGIPLSRAMQALIDQSSHPLFREKLKGVLQALLEGEQLSDALERYSDVFPRVHIRLVRIGEETGRMAEMLEEVAQYMRGQEETRSKVRRTLMYPAIVISTSFIAMYILITFSLPSLASLFREFGSSPPLTARILLAVGKYSSAHGSQTLLALLGLGVLFWRYTGSRRGNRQIDYLKFRFPIMGDLMRKSSAAWLTRTMVVLATAGVHLTDTIELLMSNAPNEPSKEAVRQIREDLLSGGSFSEALKAQSFVFPSLVSQAMSVGEQGGNMQSQLVILAKLYEQETERTVSNVINLIEPAMILFIGLMVGTIGMTVVNTVYSLLPNIK